MYSNKHSFKDSWIFKTKIEDLWKFKTKIKFSWIFKRICILIHENLKEYFNIDMQIYCCGIEVDLTNPPAPNHLVARNLSWEHLQHLQAGPRLWPLLKLAVDLPRFCLQSETRYELAVERPGIGRLGSNGNVDYQHAVHSECMFQMNCCTQNNASYLHCNFHLTLSPGPQEVEKKHGLQGFVGQQGEIGPVGKIFAFLPRHFCSWGIFEFRWATWPPQGWKPRSQPVVAPPGVYHQWGSRSCLAISLQTFP